MEGQTLKDCFTKIALDKGNKIAIRFLRQGVIETEISYLELNQDSNRLANFFIDQGVEKEDRVVLYLPKSVFFVVAHLALQKIGAMAVPLNPGFKTSEMAYLLEDADTKLVIAGTSQNSTVRQIDPRLKTIVINSETPYQALDFFRSASDEVPEISINPADPGLIVYTSGTTGKPKGAILTHKNLVHDAANVIKIWEIGDTDVLCHALPLFHVHGLCFALHTSLLAGSQVVMLDEFSPQRVVETLANKTKNPCTVFMAVPAMYNKLMDYLAEKEINFDNIRLFTSGSAPLLSKDFDRINKIFGKEPVEREGMSETGMNFSNPINGVRKPGSIGIPLPDLEVRIVDLDTFKDVNPGQEGEIWLKGPAVTPGYWGKPAETQKTFEAGWFRTGDLGRIDDDGYYYLTDRIKHIIISGGENISPKEIEAVINQLDQVVESTVVGIVDDKWGEKVVAAVIPKTDATVKVEDIQSYCKQHLHGWKCPKEVVFVDALPKNTMGKVLKEEVKMLFKV
jgi:malonyl-CoA/methylmalonyl-CoA synthetase